METKICNRCKQEKGADATCFYRNKSGKYADGLFPTCKECVDKGANHAEKVCPVCKTQFKPKMVDSSTCGNSKCTQKLSRDNNKETITLRNKKYYADNKESELKRCKAYYQENKEACYQRSKKYHKTWRDANKDKIKSYYNKEGRSEYEMNRKETDINYKIAGILRKQLVKVVRGFKNESALKLLGCSVDDFRKYLADTFQDGMSFDNYGLWQLDHILPCSAFDLQHSEEQEICFHFSNLQALWAEDNIAKSNNY